MTAGLPHFEQPGIKSSPAGGNVEELNLVSLAQWLVLCHQDAVLDKQNRFRVELQGLQDVPASRPFPEFQFGNAASPVNFQFHDKHQRRGFPSDIKALEVFLTAHYGPSRAGAPS